jgi:hypothetical protein
MATCDRHFVWVRSYGKSSTANITQLAKPRSAPRFFRSAPEHLSVLYSNLSDLTTVSPSLRYSPSILSPSPAIFTMDLLPLSPSSAPKPPSRMRGHHALGFAALGATGWYPFLDPFDFPSRSIITGPYPTILHPFTTRLALFIPMLLIVPTFLSL